MNLPKGDSPALHAASTIERYDLMVRFDSNPWQLWGQHGSDRDSAFEQLAAMKDRNPHEDWRVRLTTTTERFLDA